MVHLSEYMNTNIELPEPNCTPDIDETVLREFHNMMTSMPPTAANDFLLKVKRNLFVKLAKQLKCNAIFTAETTTTLATNLLCNLAIGRGSQVQNDIVSENFEKNMVAFCIFLVIQITTVLIYINIILFLSLTLIVKIIIIFRASPTFVMM